LAEKLKLHPKFSKDWTWLLNEAKTNIQEEKLVKWYGFRAPYGLLTRRLLFALTGYAYIVSSAEHAELEQLVARLLPQTEPGSQIHYCLLFLNHTTACLKMVDSISTFILNKPENYVQEYTSHWYKIDYEYRKAIFTYRVLIDPTALPEHFPLEGKLEELNNTYRKYLDESNREWLRCLNEKEFKFRDIPVSKQYDFYDKEIAPQEQKIAVLISDALRYEVAVELMQSLNQDSKNTVKCRNVLASLPSITKVGMANLLPCKSMRYSNDSVLVDGEPSSSSIYREAILKKKKADARAISFRDVDSQVQSENRELFKSSLVYIYHNHIDAIGDERKTERQVFKAVEDTVAELKKVINRILSSYNVYKVLVVSDHGFIYNDFQIEEKDKESFTQEDVITYHSRFQILSKPEKVDLAYTFPMESTSKFESGLFAVIPKSVNRYKLQGSGNQYVHGGGSLQELIIPILECTRQREDVTFLVDAKLLGKDLKLVSNLLKFNLIQESPVSASEKERKMSVGIYYGSDLVSEEKEVVMNKTSDNPTERIFSIDLHLISGSAQASVYKLKIYDSENDKDKLNPLIEADIRNQSIIAPDF